MIDHDGLSIEKEKAVDGLKKKTETGWNLNLEKGNGLKKVESLIKMLNWKKKESNNYAKKLF